MLLVLFILLFLTSFQSVLI